MTATVYIPGQVIVLQDVITDPVTGTLVDDATAAVTVYKPDGTTSTPAVSHASLGTYVAQITIDQTLWWEYKWQSTGAGAGAGRRSFYVAPVP